MTESLRVVDLTAKSPMEIESILESEERRGWRVKNIMRVGKGIFAFLERADENASRRKAQ